jgi:hypothetical protein
MAGSAYLACLYTMQYYACLHLISSNCVKSSKQAGKPASWLGNQSKDVKSCVKSRRDLSDGVF